MKQLNFFKPTSFKREHGGSTNLGKRKCRRPISTKTPMHLVLKSDRATGQRALTRHRPLIAKIINKAKKKFNVKVYEMAVVYNHIHLLIKGNTRRDIQNFFRVVAGHIAQEILRLYPLETRFNQKDDCSLELPAIRQRALSPDYSTSQQNIFWMSRLYSRVVTWGNEYFSVRKYVIQNTLESLGLIPYQQRKVKKHPANHATNILGARY